jgi:hypothetical protein
MKRIRVTAQPLINQPEYRMQKAKEAVEEAMQHLKDIREDFIDIMSQHDALNVTEGYATAMGLLNFAYSQLSGKDLSEILNS